MSNNPNTVWVSVVGASFARQVHDCLRDGREVTDQDADRFMEEAESIADMAIEAMVRVSCPHTGRR
jgi:hypothetical protein